MSPTKADIARDYPALHEHMLLLAHAAHIEDLGFSQVDQTVRAKYEREWRTSFADIFKPGMFKPRYNAHGVGPAFELRIGEVLAHAIVANAPLYLQQALTLAHALQSWDADDAVAKIAALYRPEEAYVVSRLNEATTTAMTRVLYVYAAQATGLYDNLDVYFDQYIMTMTASNYPNYNAQRYTMHNGRPQQRMIALKHTLQREQPHPLIAGSISVFEGVFVTGGRPGRYSIAYNLPPAHRRTGALDRLVEKLVAKWDEKVYGVQIED